MKLQELSLKQRDFLLHSDARLNLACGAVRSGKTLISIIRFLYLVATYPPGNILICAKTERTLKRNVLDLIMELLLPGDYRLNQGVGEFWLFGRRCYLVGANDERSEIKIRGLTLLIAYCDEWSTYPESFSQMLLSRLSEPSSILLGTTNPEGPAHYLKKNFIDRASEIQMKVWDFRLEDNDALDPEFVKAIKKQYVGLWYKRYILGLWVMAEGAIYPHYQDAVVPAQELPATYDAYCIGCDYGSTNPFVYLLFGRSLGVWYLIQEHYYDASKQGQRVNKQHSEELGRFLAGRKPRYIDVDPSRPEFILELRRAYPSLDVRHAINDVLPGIQNVANLMFQGKLKISDVCSHTLEEAAGYVWDQRATEKGEDAPLKQSDHCMDALRYAIMRIMRF